MVPVEALRLFAHRAVAEEKPYLFFSPETQRLIDVLVASETLRARARAIRDELAEMSAAALAESVGQPTGDLDAYLVASVVVAVWSAARVEAHGTYRRTRVCEDAQRVFLEIVERGSAGVPYMVAGTPCA